MHCNTSSRPIFDLTRTGHPRSVHMGALRFIGGIRGPRQNPVTRKQIVQWLRRTPADAVDAALADLIAEGQISAGYNALRHGNTSRRAVVYERTPKS